MAKKVKIKKWITKWCDKHGDDLERYGGMVVTLHPEKGVVNVAKDMEVAIIQAQFLKRSIARECYHLDVDAMERRTGQDVMADILADTAANTLPRMLAHEAPDVPVPEDSEPPPPLSPPIDPFDNDVIIDGSKPEFPEVGDVGTFNPNPEDKGTPFPSPDKQPPFMPRRSPLEGSVRLDGVSNPGARGTWGRGLRYD